MKPVLPVLEDDTAHTNQFLQKHRFLDVLKENAGFPRLQTPENHLFKNILQ